MPLRRWVLVNDHASFTHVSCRCFTRFGAKFAARSQRAFDNGNWNVVHDPEGKLKPYRPELSTVEVREV